MNSDSFFTIGASHKICQDYAMHGEINGKHFAIVSDGCSDAPHSDFGARLIARAAHMYVMRDMDSTTFAHSVAATANTFAKALSLPQESLCATLFTVHEDDDDNFVVRTSGDGVVAIITNDGKVEVNQYIFPSGAPPYLRYDLDQELKHLYLDKFGDQGLVFRCGWDNLNCEPHQITNFGIKLCSNEVFCETNYYSRAKIRAIIIMSDGTTAFTTLPPIHTVTIKEIVPKLLLFKGLQGEFIRRRCNRAFKNLKELGWTPQDDFSMAGVTK